ncbi:MAG: ABC transporter ATP-binding protein [Saprospiraceae bacterium]
MSKPSNLISIRGLNFAYSKDKPFIQDINLEVPAASIFGFIGHNGAGKTTTMRILLGLLQSQSGDISIFGKPLLENREEIFKRVGSLIEAPSIYQHLSGLDNLKIACRYLRVPFLKIEEVLEMVNLTNDARKVAKKYSTGMKQRLGLAMALLRDPELLVLDEPTSGLDPIGIMEFRKLMIQLNQVGKTIFLSSHLLSEVEKMATHIGIIEKGNFKFQGTMEELNNLRQSSLTIEMKTSDVNAVNILLQKNENVKIMDAETISIRVKDRNHIAAIISQVADQNIKIYEVSPQKNDLEEIFLNTIN